MARGDHTLLELPPTTGLLDEASDPKNGGLLQRAISGDSDAFARLFDRYADRVYAYMYFHLDEEQLAEDLTARVYVKAWLNIPCYKPERQPFAVWLYLIARNEVVSLRRRRQGSALVTEILSPADEGLAAFTPSDPCGDPFDP